MKTIIFVKLALLLLFTFLITSCTTDELPIKNQTNTDITPPVPGDPVITTGPRP